MALTRRGVSALGLVAIVGAGAVAYAIAETGDTHDVETAVEAFRQAMVNGDGDRLRELSDGSLSFGHSNGLVQTQVEFIDSVVSRKEVFKSIDLVGKSTSVVGDIAIERHVFKSDILLAGNPISVELAVVEVWRKTDRWRLIVRQAFKT